MVSSLYDFLKAADQYSIEGFLKIALPPHWGGVSARIIESGAQFTTAGVPWAPRWSAVPATIKTGNTHDLVRLKSIIYRVHDCLHQLWGLPHPEIFSEQEAYFYKRVQMCGEVAVLCLTEFNYVDYLWKTFPELREYLNQRNAIPMLHGPLSGRSTSQIAARLDGILHRNLMPKWVRDHKESVLFVEDYRPMLENDRVMSAANWELMKSLGWIPHGAPQSRAMDELDGLELTLWMISDFEHAITTTTKIDHLLRDFNRMRRAKINLPNGWQS